MNNAGDRPVDGLYIGLMSGTSLDGIDAALVEFSDGNIALKGFLTYPYPQALQQALNQLNEQPQASLKSLCQLEHDVAMQFTQATQALLEQTGTASKTVTAIGSHGQTVFHAPDIPMSLQIGHPAFIAKHTAVTTVADFRIDDLANGGQGAPLAPAFHRTLFAHAERLAVINIGGIANISYLSPSDTLGFDTGPGNGLMDDICRQHFGCDYDANGQLAAQTEPDNRLLAQLLTDDYFAQPAPKTTGKDYFNQAWLNRQLASFSSEQPTPKALLSTLNQLTVETLIQGLKTLPEPPTEVLICGGGAENQTLLNRLQNSLSYPVKTTADYGIHPHAMEAMMCAWLAQQRLLNRAIPLVSITGAKRDSILGGIWHA
ncbi:anhydro-N-acetylmuramic acid kinase [Thiomicrospira sp. S5]|uniref:anhydro-N-acetylmuramic acid kinase n=1 Tax=Thiomicrospira sp. S5 TaxID=1803865 RepID=UPI001EFFEA70|nr:anhydro-N-acetylmuramic acid kinase [Thiomicrospira sp. S5]